MVTSTGFTAVTLVASGAVQLMSSTSSVVMTITDDLIFNYIPPMPIRHNWQYLTFRPRSKMSTGG
jgi:hypothetical protein